MPTPLRKTGLENLVYHHYVEAGEDEGTEDRFVDAEFLKEIVERICEVKLPGACHAQRFLEDGDLNVRALGLTRHAESMKAVIFKHAARSNGRHG